jgi:hypothetical protein
MVNHDRQFIWEVIYTYVYKTKKLAQVSYSKLTSVSQFKFFSFLLYTFMLFNVITTSILSILFIYLRLWETVNKLNSIAFG